MIGLLLLAVAAILLWAAVTGRIENLWTALKTGAVATATKPSETVA